MQLSKLSSRRVLPALLVLILAAGGNALAAKTVITDEGSTGGTAPPAEEGSAPPPAPVATEDSAILICPQAGGKNISYEVHSPLEGASCSTDRSNNTVLCERADGFPIAGASCKKGCDVFSPKDGSCTKNEGTRVTR